MIDLDGIPDPPARLCEFRRADWPVPPTGTDTVMTTHELRAREQWRQAREQWGREHGLPWAETEQILARARARLRAQRARSYATVQSIPTDVASLVKDPGGQAPPSPASPRPVGTAARRAPYLK